MPKPVCTVKADAFGTYDPALFTLIPLHVYSATMRRKKGGKVRPVGKAPRDPQWSTRDYNSKATVRECVAHNANMGVRLKPDQLVIDVDPRNGGTEGFAKLCAALSIDPAIFPTVITGSGGLHLYMSKPADLLIVDTLDGYAGVEFKSKGRQVVAAGSVHPGTLRHYEWDTFGAPAIADGLPPIPDKLLRVITRPEREVMVRGGGQWNQEQAAEALADLDPEDFRDHAEWLKVLMGIHHATNGDARHEFIEWSTLDPQYADDAESIGRRWDSLHMSRPEGAPVVTYRTILQIIKAKGRGKFTWVDTEEQEADFDALAAEADEDDVTPTPPPTKPKAKSKLPGGKSVDEDDVTPENPGGFNDASTALLEDLNQDYATIVDGGKFRVIFQQHEPLLDRKSWEKMNGHDFMLLHGNRRVERSEDELEKLSRSAAPTQPLGKAWLEWAQRKHYKGLIFDPRGVAHDGYLNTWTGFALGRGRQGGSWNYLNDLIFNVLAQGDEANYNYILNWLRFLFQHPEKRAEVAMVFMGGKGVGKGTLGNTITRCIGHHAMSIKTPTLITGRFNSHFRDLLFLFADEAVKPHDKASESQLKGLITEPEIAIEGKGADVKQAPNLLHIMMASNEHWVVPASADERRYFVTQCTGKYQNNSAWFDKLYAELSRDDLSGYRAFLWDMLTTEMPANFHPRAYPLTAALVDQKVRSQSPLSQFFYDALNEEIIPFRVAKGDWHKERVRVFVSDFREAFAQWQRERGMNVGSMGRGSMRFVFKELEMIFPSVNIGLRQPVTEEFEGVIHPSPSDGRAKAIELPSMAECKQFFNESLGGDCFAGDFG